MRTLQSIVTPSFVLILALMIPGCEEDNPRHCQTNPECIQKIQDGVYDNSDDGDGFTVGAKKIYCHPTKNYCYAGCGTDADCKNPAFRMNADEPGKTTCNMTTHHCEAPASDGGVDGHPTNLPLGGSCESSDQCKQGHCVDKVCCDSECAESCMSCSVENKGHCSLVPGGKDFRGDCKGTDEACTGYCDGQGGCTFPSTGEPCGTPTCQDGFLTEYTCNDLGICLAGEPTGCQGFACDPSEKSCKNTCAGPSDCMDTFTCLDLTCKADLPLGDPCYDQDGACNSKNCVDSVCCESASCEDCNRCDGPNGAAKGKCAPVNEGTAPLGQCLGDPACGAQLCNNQGACAYLDQGTLCSSVCSSGIQTNYSCSSSHTCNSATTLGCGAYNCDSAGVKCLTGCQTHADCMASSVCDRSTAHETGAGQCIDPLNVVTVNQGDSLQGAIDSLSGQTYIKVIAGTLNYAGNLTITDKNLTIIGVNKPVITPGASPAPVISISDNSSVTLQELVLQGGNGTFGHGLNCNGGRAGTPHLQLFESIIKSNEVFGIFASNCNVNLQRNTIQQNNGGGLSLSGGTFLIANNVIADNGSSNSNIGGALLNGTVTFVNNTVVGNDALSAKAGGIICSGGEVLKNTILQNNSGTSQFGLCAFEHSNIFAGTPVTVSGPGNISVDCGLDPAFKPAVPSGCVDHGDNNATGLGLLDHDSRTRISGTVDMGAFEVN